MICILHKKKCFNWPTLTLRKHFVLVPNIHIIYYILLYHSTIFFSTTAFLTCRCCINKIVQKVDNRVSYYCIVYLSVYNIYIYIYMKNWLYIILIVTIQSSLTNILLKNITIKMNLYIQISIPNDNIMTVAV